MTHVLIRSKRILLFTNPTVSLYCRYLEKGSNYKNIVLRYLRKSEFFQKRFCHWFKRRLCSVILSQRVDNGVGLKVI